MENIKIRLEEKKDWKAVENLTRKAFWREERIGKIGIGATEHYMVHKMRDNDGINELTFVAEIDEVIVGHIIYSKNSYVLQDNGLKKEVLNFGPLSVLPNYQKKGIGSALMNYSIKRAKELAYGAIIFFGHPTYYPKFGFVEASKFNITTASGDNFSAFMAMELQAGYLNQVSGKFIESPIYDEKLTKGPARAYDLNFCPSPMDPFSIDRK
jgi:predicted N-acetyltransferase YhbS